MISSTSNLEWEVNSLKLSLGVKRIRCFMGTDTAAKSPKEMHYNLRLLLVIHSHTHTKRCILNWPLPIGAFQGQWNTTKQRKGTTTTTTAKNPDLPEANQLAIYKCGWEVEPGTTRNKFNTWSERGLNPGAPDLEASALTIHWATLLPHTLLTNPHWGVRPMKHSKQ